MSSKINVWHVVTDHFATLKNGDRYSWIDCAVFLAFPIFISALLAWKEVVLTKDAVSMLVNFGSIFTALLLSLLMLVYEQQNKLEDRNKATSGGVPFFDAKKELLDQLYSNITFSVVMSMLIVSLSLIQTMVEGHEVQLWGDWGLNSKNRLIIYVLSPILLFLTVNAILTIFMIVKRTYALLKMKM
ncbi:hypothetical protein [Chromobacterium amazonense]|nr:hypothetical protein [Chromobacterium amazonense]